MYQTARNFGNDGNSSTLNTNESKTRKDYSVDSRNEMHFQPPL